MLHNFNVIWVLAVFINVSTAAASTPADADTEPICGESSCTCGSDVIQCSGLSSLELLPHAATVERLLLRDSHLPELNVSVLQRLPQLRRLDVVNCSLQGVVGDWNNPHLETVNLSGNGFTTFSLHWLEGLPELRQLNLSGNPLDSVSAHPDVESHLQSLDLTGNHWNCTDHSLTWLVRWLDGFPSHHLANERAARCKENRTQYLTMHGRPLVDVLRLTEAMLKQCPSGPPFGCSCDLIQVEGPSTASTTSSPSPSPAAGGGAGDDEPLVAAMVEVYCDDRGLTEFPPRLPDNTKTLYIRNNSLTDFGPVVGNLTGYRALTTLYMDGNLLEAADANRLEGSEFIERFSILSLARNRLQTLPLYAFDNAFQKRTFNVDSLFLGGNPWLCDCDSPFTFSFRTWLASQHKLIRDRSAIRCGSGPLAEPPPGPPLLALSRSKHCGKLHINWWDVAVGLLALALAVVLIKFAYDVMVYRRTGELPLMVKKLPW